MAVMTSVLVFTLTSIICTQGYNYGGSLFLSRDDNQPPVEPSGLTSFFQMIGVSSKRKSKKKDHDYKKIIIPSAL